MSLIIAIETSSSDYELALGDTTDILFNSAEHKGLNATKDLGLLLRTGLEETGRNIKETSLITINIGPGGLGAVRSGVSFANGLSFGLGVPLLPLTAFELVGYKVSQKGGAPVLITSNAADGHAYGGLYAQDALQEYRFGLLGEVAGDLCSDISSAFLAGTHQEELSAFLPDMKLEKTGIKFASARTHLEYIATHDIAARLTHEPTTALNETSIIFKRKKGG